MKMSEKLATAFSEQVTKELSCIGGLPPDVGLVRFDRSSRGCPRGCGSNRRKSASMPFASWTSSSTGATSSLSARARSPSPISNLPRRSSRQPWPRNNRPRTRSGICT